MNSRQTRGFAQIALPLWAGLIVLAIALFVASIPPHYHQLATLTYPGIANPPGVEVGLSELGISAHAYGLFISIIKCLIAFGFFTIAIGISLRKLDDPFVLLVSASLIVFGATFPDTLQALVSEQPAWDIPVRMLGMAGFIGFFSLFLLFPSGRFIPAWTVVLIPLWIIEEWFQFFPASTRILSQLLFVAFLGLMACSVLAQIHRYRHVSTPVERQQTKWIVFGFAISVPAFLVYGFTGQILTSGKGYVLHEVIGGSLMSVTFLLLPASIALAVMRRDLWSIDRVINRALVYGILSTTGVGLYLLLLVAIGTMAGRNSTPIAGAISVGIAAIVIQPVRLRLQREVNRLLYGQRDDPYIVLSHLGRRLEESSPNVPPFHVVVQTIAEALRLPYAAITIKEGAGFLVVAEVGTEGPDTCTFPLTYQHVTIGELRVSPRARDEGFDKADNRLLNDMAFQSGIAVHEFLLQRAARQLSQDLLDSRKRLVTLREEERKRLRRELHDGLGPQLAALTLRIDAARNLLRTQPGRTEELLMDLSGQVRASVEDVRRIAHGLRSPALDELGIVGALRQVAMQFDCDDLRVTVHANDNVPPLPAAAEAAIYRIVQESIANVVRHSQATICTVTISVDPGSSMIFCDIQDNGRGFSTSQHTGIGQSSMRERAAELHGTLTMTSIPVNGTLISARIPCLMPEVVQCVEACIPEGLDMVARRSGNGDEEVET